MESEKNKEEACEGWNICSLLSLSAMEGCD